MTRLSVAGVLMLVTACGGAREPAERGDLAERKRGDLAERKRAEPVEIVRRTGGASDAPVTKTRFVPPSAKVRFAAVGRTLMLSERFRRAFSPFGFEPVSAPQPGEWLAEFRERGQSYDNYLDFRANRADGERRVLYFQPIGAWPSDAFVSQRELRDFTRAYFGLTVKILPPVMENKLDVRGRARFDQPYQLNSRDLLDALQQRVPDDAYALIGITFTDLYPTDDWNFVFGEASLRRRVAVQSLARYDPAFSGEEVSDAAARDLARKRSFKVLAHEIGHMFGMEHCTFYRCAMNGTNSLSELDTANHHLCPVCLRKLHSATKYQPVERYQQLGRIYQRARMESEFVWTAARARHIEGNEQAGLDPAPTGADR